MNDAMLWTLIVGTLAIQAAVLTVVIGAQTRVLKAEVGRITDRLDSLDRDVHAVIVKLMGNRD